jgi:hypothetical protein
MSPDVQLYETCRLRQLDHDPRYWEWCSLLLPQLALRQQQVLVFASCGLNETDIAAIFDVSAAAVSKHVRVIKARARRLLFGVSAPVVPKRVRAIKASARRLFCDVSTPVVPKHIRAIKARARRPLMREAA